MTGDGVGQLQLRPVPAGVLDQPLALRICHAQHEPLGIQVHDLTCLAVEAQDLVRRIISC
jgi:hypothetical protein